MKPKKIIIYIDDALGSPRRSEPFSEQEIEWYTFEDVLGGFNSRLNNRFVLGFGTYEEAHQYMLQHAGEIVLIVCDHNLWWGEKVGTNGAKVNCRYGSTFMNHMREESSDLCDVPIIVYTDSPDYAEKQWRIDQVPFIDIIPKYSVEGIKPAERLYEKVAECLRDIEGYEGSLSVI